MPKFIPCFYADTSTCISSFNYVSWPFCDRLQQGKQQYNDIQTRAWSPLWVSLIFSVTYIIHYYLIKLTLLVKRANTSEVERAYTDKFQMFTLRSTKCYLFAYSFPKLFCPQTNWWGWRNLSFTQSWNWGYCSVCIYSLLFKHLADLI